MTGQELRNSILDIRSKLLKGDLSYDEAKRCAKPIIDEMNSKAREVAQRWGKKHHNFTFSQLMR